MKKTTLGAWRLGSLLSAAAQAPRGAWHASSALQSKRQVALWLGHCQVWPKASLEPGRTGPIIALGAGRGQTKHHVALGQLHPRPAA
jgi:hypothetical protein